MPDVWRVRSALAFAALARPRDHGGFRRRSGPVTISWVPQRTVLSSAADPPSMTADGGASKRSTREASESVTPSVAFAIGRRVGPAVVRNRLRRRLRAELRELTRRGELIPGCYLIGLHPDAGELAGDRRGGELLAHLHAGLRVDRTALAKTSGDQP